MGVVTSPASSPRLGTIGLAILDADVANDGEKVEVAIEGGTAPATVEVLSLLDPEQGAPAGVAGGFEASGAGLLAAPLC